MVVSPSSFELRLAALLAMLLLLLPPPPPSARCLHDAPSLRLLEQSDRRSETAAERIEFRRAAGESGENKGERERESVLLVIQKNKSINPNIFFSRWNASVIASLGGVLLVLFIALDYPLEQRRKHNLMPPSKESEALASYVSSVGGHLSSALDFLSAAGAGGRGVVATAAMRKGANLATVPVAACLFVPKPGEHASTPAAGFLRDFNEEKTGQQQEQQLSPFAAAVALLLAEAAAGSRSPHSPFLASLPFGGALVDGEDDDGEEGDPENETGSTVKCLDCVLAWRPKELKLLSGTSAHDDGGGARKLFEETMKPLYASRPDLWPKPYDSFAAFVRAACLVQSRAFHLRATNFATGATSDDADGGTLYLIPGIDQVNHSCRDEVRSTALERVSTAPAAVVAGEEKEGEEKGEKEEKGKGKVAQKIDLFSMKADRDIRAGEEVFHGYGDSLSDAELLTTYGFVPEGGGEEEEEEEGKEAAAANPSNTAVLLAETLVEAASAISGAGKAGGGDGEGVSERAAALKKAGAFPQAFTITRADRIPNALFGVASLLCLGKVAADEGEGENDEQEERQRQQQQQQREAADALWLEAQGDLRSVVDGLGIEEALEDAPEIAYAASLAIEKAAAAAVECLQAGKRAAEEEERKNDGSDVVFARRAKLARAVRLREVTLLRMLQLSAIEAAAAALEAIEEHESDEGDGDGDREEEQEKGEKKATTATAIAPPSPGEKKRAAASEVAAASSEKKKKSNSGELNRAK